MTRPIAVSVYYEKNLPAQNEPTSIVDMVIGLNNTSKKGTSPDLISSVASDVVLTTKNND